MPFGIKTTREEFQRQQNGIVDGLPAIRSVEDGSLIYGEGETEDERPPVAEWLRPLIFNALNRSPSNRLGFEASSGHMWDKPGCSRWFFSGFFPFSPHLTTDAAQNEWNNIDRP